jgi:hypothetical protein
MARKPDVSAAAKARKQKIILIIGGVALLGLGALQGPKLLKHGGSAATAAAPATVTETSPNVAVVAVAPADGTAAGTSSGTVAVASLAGVQIRNAGDVAADESQLWSFSMFDEKDPFVPQGAAEPPAEPDSAPVQGDSPPAAEPAKDPAATQPAAQETPAPEPAVQQPATNVPVAGGTEPVVPPKPAFATIEVNGAAQQLAPGDTFPKLTPVFVLAGLKQKSAKIGVAGGSFSNGKTAGLELGKSLTAVDTATGVRYELKLVYLGAQPEVVEPFTSGSGKQPAAPSK